MTEVTISLRVEKKVHEQMKIHDEVNWSAVLRKSIAEKIESLETIDKERARKASKTIEQLRKAKTFDSGKMAVEMVREWRDKKR